jgi:hypothetical protein
MQERRRLDRQAPRDEPLEGELRIAPAPNNSVWRRRGAGRSGGTTRPESMARVWAVDPPWAAERSRGSCPGGRTFKAPPNPAGDDGRRGCAPIAGRGPTWALLRVSKGVPGGGAASASTSLAPAQSAASTAPAGAAP